MSILDYLLLGLLAAGLWAALRAIKRSDGQCGGGCAACPMNGQCSKGRRKNTGEPPVSREKRRTL